MAIGSFSWQGRRKVIKVGDIDGPITTTNKQLPHAAFSQEKEREKTTAPGRFKAG